MATEVRVGENESIENALRRFKKVVERSGVIQELKKREFYQKPSVLKHQKAMEIQRRNIKMTKKMKELERRDDNPADQKFPVMQD